MCKHYKLGFPTGRDSATFRDSGTGKKNLSRDKGTRGQKFLHCPRTKGQPQNLTTGRAGTAKIRDGTGRDTQNPGQDAGQNGTEQKRSAIKETQMRSLCKLVPPP